VRCSAWIVLLVLGGCHRSNVKTFTVEQPSSVVVGYISGHKLYSWRHAPVVLRNTDSWSIEAIRTTDYYLVPPGTYRLFNHDHPTIKTLRRRATRSLVGDRVSEVLDASTDTNDERGHTLESWYIVPRNARPYFVLLDEPTNDASEEFSVALFDEQGSPIYEENSGFRLHGPWESVNGVRWLGPLTGPVRLEVMTLDTTPRKYALRVAQPDDEAADEPRTVPAGTVVTGALGPGVATWEKEHDGWGARVTFTSEIEQPLFATFWWTPDHALFGPPSISASDENGHFVVLEDVLRKGGPDEYAYVATGVRTTKRPVRELRLHIRAQNIRTVSGRYALCVATDATSCRGKSPGTPARGW
jgi:hypothetical protein